MPMKRYLYPLDWPLISKRIRERENNRCKFCKVPNGAVVLRSDCGTMYMFPEGQTHQADDGSCVGTFRMDEAPVRFDERTPIKIVLTVAHLDWDPGNNAESNLAALCQRCHLAHDRVQHQASARKTRQAKKAVRELF